MGTSEDTAIRPFRVDIPEEALADLRRRIAMTRWPDRETVERRVPGRATGDHSGTRPLLGNGLRLAEDRG